MPHPNVTVRKDGSDEIEKVLLSIEDFMAMYDYARASTYDLLNHGKIEGVKDGRRTKIVRASADQYIASLPRYREARAA